MGKITVNPGDLRKNQPKGEHIDKIMYDDNEPPKNYIWAKSDGYKYQWNGIKWVPLDEISNVPMPQPSVHPHNPNPDAYYITKLDLDARLKVLKTEIISYLTKLINTRDCSGGSEAVIEWINENIIPDLRRLQEIDHDSFATKVELTNITNNFGDNINELKEADVNINYDIDALDARLDSLEAFDHSKFITADLVSETTGVSL